MFKRLFIRAFMFLTMLTLVLCGFLYSSWAQKYWTNLGLYGGQIYEIAIDPDDSDKMFAGAYYGNGFYLTEDGGDNWEPVLTGHEGGELDGEATFRNTAVWAVKIAPSIDENPDNNLVWVVHNYWAEKSTDGGANWTHIENGTMQDDCDGCPNDSTAENPGSEQFRYCESLAIDPNDSQTVYVGTGGPYSTDKEGAIYKRTTDGGIIWTKIGVVDEHFDPDGSGSFYEERDLDNEFYSTVVDIAIHPTDSNIIWALDFNDVLGKYAGILYLSTNGGDDWSWDVAMGAYMGEAGLVVKPDEPNVVFIGTFWGIVRVEYDVDNWSDTPAISYPIGWEGGKNVRALAFDPQDSDVLYAALGLNDNFQLLKSENGGINFNYVYNHDYQFIALTVHPDYSDVIFGGERLLGVYKGIYNSSQSDYIWTPINNGINSIRVNDIAADPNDSDHLLTGTMAGVYEKQGSGAWTPTASLPYTEAFSVEFDPSDTDGSSYYAGAESRLAKTTDHGANWTLSNNLGYPHFVNDIAIDPNTTNTLFITTRYPGSVWRSTDGGSNLTQVLSSTTFDFGAVAIDPKDSSNVYAGGGNYFGSDVPGNLYESTTGGGSGTWITILPNVTVNALLIDPDNTNIIYAGCGYSGGTEIPVYKSTDGGTNWVKAYEGIPGEPTRYGIWGSSASNIFILGHTGSVVKGGEDDMNILHFDGTWTQMDIRVSTPLYGIWGSSGSDIFAVGNSGTIVHYSGGSDWDENPMDSGTAKDLKSVWGSSASNVFAVGKSGTMLQYNGSSWSSMTSGTYKDLFAVWGTNDGSHVYAVGSYGTILHNTGSGWSKMESGVKEPLKSVWGSSGSNVFAVGKSGTILKYNGSNWSPMTSGTSKDLLSVWGSSGSDVYAVGEDGVILHSNGTSWTPMTSGTSSRLYGVWGSTSSSIHAVGLYGTILHCTGYPSGWTPVSTGLTEFPAWNAVTDLKFKDDGGNRIIYASTSRQGIYASTNQAGNWVNMSTLPYEVHALATGSVIVATEGGVLSMSGYGLMYGQVTGNGEPIADASVTTDLGKSTDTASDGGWSMGHKAGTYAVTATADGYGSETAPVVPIYDGTNTFVSLELNDRVIYVRIGGGDILATGGIFEGPNGSITPIAGDFSWSEAGNNGELMVPLDGSVTLDIVPDQGFHVQQVLVDGDEQPPVPGPIEFVNMIDSHTLAVLFNNDPPTIFGAIPDQSEDEDADPWTLDLTDYESDVEDSGTDLDWSVSGVNTSLFTAVITDSDNDILTFTPVAHAYGSDVITLTLTDSGGLTDTQNITVTLNSQNDPPIVSDIPNQTIIEGGTFTTITLDNYVTDVDNMDAEMNWTYSGNTDLIVSINASRVATISTPNENWNGAETITFRATDPGEASDSDDATFTVTAVNDSPIADAGPDQNDVTEGITITLNGSGSSDLDGDPITYQWTQTGGTTVTLSDDKALQPTFVTPPVDINGITLSFQLTVKDNGGLQDTDEVSIKIKDNGITGFPDDAVTFTSITDEDMGINIGGGNLTSLNTIDPDTIADTNNKPEGLIYGLIDIEIKVTNPGDTSIGTIYLSNPAPADYKWYKYSSTLGWVDFSRDVISGGLGDGAEFNGTRTEVTLYITDNGDYDDDPTDAIIKDPTGLGIAPTTPGPTPPPSGGGCFIATAAYGSYMEPHVKVLRDFRDRFLLTNPVGKTFVDLYYIYSPPVADFIASHDTVRLMVRWRLLPMVGMSWVAINIGPVAALTFMFLLGFGLVGLVSARRRFRK